jgi:DNA-binding transcriptional regulator YiaG
MEQIDVKAIREAMGLTREEFAALVPVDPVTVWRWESGTSPHPIIHERLKELAGKLKKRK